MIYFFQVILTPITFAWGLVLNLSVFRRTPILEAIYPPCVYLVRYTILLNAGSCLAAFIWPFLYTVLGMYLPLSQSLPWFVYMTYYHPVIRGIFIKSRGLLLAVFGFERSVGPLILFWNSIEKSYRPDRESGTADESSRFTRGAIISRVKNFRIRRRNRVNSRPCTSSASSVDIGKYIYRWDYFLDAASFGLDYKLLRNANFIRIVSLLCLATGVLFSMSRIKLYKISVYEYPDTYYRLSNLSTQNPSHVSFTTTMIYSRKYKLKGKGFWIAYSIDNTANLLILILNLSFALKNAGYYLKIKRYFNISDLQASNILHSDIYFNHKPESKYQFTWELKMSQLQLWLSVTHVLNLIPNCIFNLVQPIREASLNDNSCSPMPPKSKLYSFDVAYPMLTYLELLSGLLISVWIICLMPELKFDWLRKLQRWVPSIIIALITKCLFMRGRSRGRE
ncbi:unnamed protein product [Gordionus sp. m RMFG-2023]